MVFNVRHAAPYGFYSLDSIFAAETHSAPSTASMSDENIIVPWCMTRPRAYTALAENFLPSMSMSFLPDISADAPVP
jgi:hypothetical protein